MIDSKLFMKNQVGKIFVHNVKFLFHYLINQRKEIKNEPNKKQFAVNLEIVPPFKWFLLNFWQKKLVIHIYEYKCKRMGVTICFV